MNNQHTFLAVFLLLGSCQSLDLEFDKANRPATLEESAVVSVSALPALRFDEVRKKLRPNYNATSAKDFRANAIENTLSVLSSYRSSSGAGVGINLAGTSSTSTITDTSTSATDAAGETTSTSGQNATSTQTQSSGEPPSNLPSAQSFGELKPAFASSNFGADQILTMENEMLAFMTATFSDLYFDSDLRRNGQTAWVIRLRVTVQPKARDMPYDLFVNLEPDESTTFSIVPLFATGSHESSSYNSILTQLQQVSANLSAATGGVGIGGNFDEKLEKLIDQAGLDINTRVSVGFSGDDLRISLPAAFSPKSGYELREQSYTVTFLAFTEEPACEKYRRDKDYFSSFDEFRSPSTPEGSLKIGGSWGLRDATKVTTKIQSNTLDDTKNLDAVSIPLKAAENYLPASQIGEYFDDGVNNLTAIVRGNSIDYREGTRGKIFFVENDVIEEFSNIGPLQAANQFCEAVEMFEDGPPRPGVSRSTPVLDVKLGPIRSKSSSFSNGSFSTVFPSKKAQNFEMAGKYVEDIQEWTPLLRLETSPLKCPVYDNSGRKTDDYRDYWDVRCYPLLENVAKSGKIPAAKSPFTASLVQSVIPIPTDKKSELTLYIDEKDNFTSAYQKFSVTVTGGSIPPSGVEKVGTPNVPVSRTPIQVAKNSFEMGLDDVVNIKLEKLSAGEGEVLIKPINSKTNKPTTLFETKLKFTKK